MFVYAIINKPGRGLYIGVTTSIPPRRFAQHRYFLRRGIHPNCILQGAWLKYGEPAFNFIVLCVTSREIGDLLESALIKHHSTTWHIYNIGEGGFNTGADPIRRLCQAEKVRRLWTDPTYRLLQLQKQKVRRASSSDLDARESFAIRMRAIWADPARRFVQSQRSKTLWADPTYRILQSRKREAWQASMRALQPPGR